MRILVLAILAAMTVESDQAAVVGEDCQVPDAAKEWDPNPKRVIIDVRWEYGNQTTCSSRQACNNSYKSTNDTNTSGALLGDDDDMKIQLIPVEVQSGNALKFHFDAIESSDPFNIYLVDEPGFLFCYHQNGTRVEGPDVSADSLKAGNNYFVVEDHGIVQCKQGLRLNVTVKTGSCQHSETQLECSGRGRCVTYTGQANYSCYCCGNYKGNNCDIYDACLSNPCYYGGECLHNQTDQSNSTYLDQYYCKCPQGYYGDHCEKNTTDMCEITKCDNNATCTGNATDFECACLPGYTGSHCESDINECEASPCRHGRCIDFPNDFLCMCLPGYYGRRCQEKRQPCFPNPCRHGGHGENKTVGMGLDWECHCHPRWTGQICNDLAYPCASNPCVHGLCMEHDLTYECRCDAGYTGRHCEVNINECQANPCWYAGRCRDLVNGYTCLCLPTHAGPNCQYTIDMFYPVLDDIDSTDRTSRLREENKNLYIMAATLSIAIVTLVSIILVCYCRRGDAINEVCGVRVPSLRRSPPGSDGSLTVGVDANSSLDCPLTSDAFFKSDPSSEGLDNKAFDNQLV